MIERQIDYGKEILCKADEILYYLKRIARKGFLTVSGISQYTVPASHRIQVFQSATPAAIRIYNDTHYRPDILRVYLSTSSIPIPVNSGESIDLGVKEGITVYAKFDRYDGNIVVVEYEV